MRFDDFMYGGDMYNGDMFSDMSGGLSGLSSIAPQMEQPISGLDALVAPSEAAPFTLTPEMTADIQRRAQLSMAPNAAFGLSSMDPGVLSQADPLFEYAQTAPILELKGNKEYETLKFQPLPNTNYKLVVGGKDLGTASTPEQVAALVNAANEISEAGGKTADVRLQKETQYADSDGAVQTAFADVYANKQNNAGALEFLLPAVLSAASLGVLAPAIAPGLGAALGISKGAAATLAAALASGAGTTTGKLALGSSLGEALKQGGISAVTAGLMQGAGLNDALKGALGGASAGGGPQLSDAFNAARGAGGALQDVFATSGLGALGSSAGQAANEILVSAARNAAPSILSQVAPSVVQAGLSNLGQSLLPSQPATTRGPLTEQAPPSFAALPGDSPLITVLGSVPASNAFPSLAAGLSGIAPVALAEAAKSIAAGQPQSDVQPGDSEGITVTATPMPPSVPGGLDYLSPIIANLIPQPTPSVPAEPQSDVRPGDEEEIIVKANPYEPPKITDNILTSVAPAIVGNLGPDIPGTAAAEPETAFDKAKRIGGRVLQGLAVLGPLLAGTGGKQGQGLSTLGPGAAAIGTRASLDPTFSARLPAPGGLFAAQAMAPRNMGNIDYARYGYGPARSFFENVPDTPEQYRTALATAAPRPMTPQAPGGFNPNLNILDQFGANSVRRFAPNATDEQVNAFLTSPAGIDFIAAVRESESPQGLARGGAMAVKGKGRPSRDSYAVNGPGTGRSDEIPALLSDGEYVIDAETVAMLGDGSSAAGAKRLDDLRVKIRKHKGRNLAKGRFSDNAKRPEKYLSGGRA